MPVIYTCDTCDCVAEPTRTLSKLIKLETENVFVSVTFSAMDASVICCKACAIKKLAELPEIKTMFG